MTGAQSRTDDRQRVSLERAVQELLHAAAMADRYASTTAYLPDAFLTRW